MATSEAVWRAAQLRPQPVWATALSPEGELAYRRGAARQAAREVASGWMSAALAAQAMPARAAAHADMVRARISWAMIDAESLPRALRRQLGDATI